MTTEKKAMGENHDVNKPTTSPTLFTWEVKEALAEGDMEAYQEAIQHMIDTQDLEPKWFMYAFREYSTMKDWTEWESEMYMERLENVAAIANQPTRQAMTDFLANAFKFGMIKCQENGFSITTEDTAFNNTASNSPTEPDSAANCKVRKGTKTSGKVRKGSKQTAKVVQGTNPAVHVMEIEGSTPLVRVIQGTRPDEKVIAELVKKLKLGTRDFRLVVTSYPKRVWPEMTSQLPTQLKLSKAQLPKRKLSTKRTYSEWGVPVALPGPHPVPLRSVNRPYVFVDIRSVACTDLDIDTIQIAAVSANGAFHRYVTPYRRMNSKAVEETKMAYKDGVMYFRDSSVLTVTLRKALTEFLEFLGNEQVILVGHNCKSIASQRLVANAEISEINIQSAIYGFLDTYPLFKAAYPDLKSPLQPELHKHFFPTETYDVKNALDTAISLKCLVQQACPDRAEHKPYTFTVDFAEDLEGYEHMTSIRVAGWETAIQRDFVSRGIARKAAASGLEVENLHWAFEHWGGTQALKAVLTEEVNGEPRVTKNRKVLRRIIEYIDINQ